MQQLVGKSRAASTRWVGPTVPFNKRPLADAQFVGLPTREIKANAEVRILCGDQLVASDPRCWEKEQHFFDPIHYLGLLERDPGDDFVTSQLRYKQFLNEFLKHNRVRGSFKQRRCSRYVASTKSQCRNRRAFLMDLLPVSDVILRVVPAVKNRASNSPARRGETMRHWHDRGLLLETP